MGLRFRKRLKVAPGITFNLSWSEKKGITTSSTLGAPGANVNIGTRKDGSLGLKRGTLGVPGSGVSFHDNLDNTKALSKNSQDSVENQEVMCDETEGSVEHSGSWLETFAYSKTINWILNIAIFAILFYVNR